MELTEAVQRIVRHHIFLILAMVVLGMLVPLGLESGRDPSYKATARVGFDAADTATAEEAKSRTDTATAIITSQGNVGFALEKAGIDRRSRREVAENHVSVQAIGTSSVLELSVTDKDPKHRHAHGQRAGRRARHRSRTKRSSALPGGARSTARWPDRRPGAGAWTTQRAGSARVRGRRTRQLSRPP